MFSPIGRFQKAEKDHHFLQSKPSMQLTIIALLKKTLESNKVMQEGFRGFLLRRLRKAENLKRLQELQASL